MVTFLLFNYFTWTFYLGMILGLGVYPFTMLLVWTYAKWFDEKVLYDHPKLLTFLLYLPMVAIMFVFI